MFRCVIPLLIAVCSFVCFPALASAKPRPQATAQALNNTCAAAGNLAVATVHVRDAGGLPSMLMDNALHSLPKGLTAQNKEAFVQFHRLIIVYVFNNPEVSALTAQQFVETACFKAVAGVTP